MYKITTEQMSQIKASRWQGLEAQEAVFNALDFNPYDDEDMAATRLSRNGA